MNEYQWTPVMIGGVPVSVTNTTRLFLQPFQEFVYTEADDNGAPKVEVDKNAGKPPADAKWYEHAKAFLSKILRQFITWLGKIGQSIRDKFSKNYASQIKYVGGNQRLNQEIEKAIGDGSFKPTITNWPLYKVPIDEIVQNQKKIMDIIQPYIDKKTPVDQVKLQIKKDYYPDKVSAVITESFVMEEEAPKQEEQKKGISENAKKLQNYFLYGTPTPTQTTTDQLSPGLWKDLVDNILNCDKAIDLGVRRIVDDLQKAGQALQKDVDNLKYDAQQDRETASNTEQGAGAGLMDERAVNKEDAARTLQGYVDLITKEISNEYFINFANTMQQEFFVKSYNLYKDMVNAYKNTKGLFEQQQPQQQT